MAHYALVDGSNTVVSVIVSDNDPILFEITQQMATEVSGRWIQTSYNTRENVHYGPDGLPDGFPGLRKNYAGIGYTYSDELDAFIPPKPPFESWVLDTDKGTWKAPVDKPDTVNYYVWDEATVSWKQVDPPVRQQTIPESLTVG